MNAFTALNYCARVRRWGCTVGLFALLLQLVGATTRAQEKPIEIELVREEITIQSVRSQLLPQKLLSLRLSPAQPPRRPQVRPAHPLPLANPIHITTHLPPEL